MERPLRPLGNLLIATSLVAGALAATTAYVPRLTDDDSALAAGAGYAHLNAPAGARRDAAGGFVLDADGQRIPLADTGSELTPQLQARLRAAGVERVRVREFSIRRWQHAWLFGLAVIGLIAGSALVKRETASRGGRQPADRGTTVQATPQAVLARIVATARDLQRELPGMPGDAARTSAILERVGHVQTELSLQVVEGRNVLVAALGLARFAELMDAFSRLERALNRAWSAAADGALDEALRCIDDAAAHAPEVERRLR